jgi:undecaprenyl-diphosphatase
MDFWIFQLINGLAGRIPFLDGLMRLVTSEYFSPTAMSLLLLALWFTGKTTEERRRNQTAVVRASMALLLSNVLLKLCNLAYFRPRPFAHHEVNLLFYRPWDSSLPSNPAVVGFSFAVAVFFNNRRAGFILLGFATLFGISRIWCGVHYPLDIITGAALGALVAYFIFKARSFYTFVDFIIEFGRRIYLA